MAYMTFISGDPHTASSWQGGLPTETDVAVFDASSAAFTATQTDNWGGVLFSGYTQTFSRGAFDLTLGSQGFVASTPTMAGTVNLGTATITNYGNFDSRGLPVPNFIAKNAIWHQKGGTLNNHVTWEDNGSGRRPFANLIFDEDCFATVTNLYYESLVTINGNLSLSTRFCSALPTGGVTIGPNADVSGPGYIEVYLSWLRGHIENIHNLESIRFRAGTTGTAGGSFKVPVIFRSSEGSLPINVTFTDNPEFFNTVTFQLEAATVPNYNITLNDARFYGDIISTRNTGTGTIVNYTGTMQLAGTADQDIDTSVIDGVVSLSSQKAIGNVDIIGGNFSINDDSDFGGKLTFAAGYNGEFTTNNYAIQINGFDAGGTIPGTIDLGTSIVTNYGNFDGSGLLLPNFVINGATWIQKGGTSSNRIQWRDGGNVQRKFTNLIFEKGSFIELVTGILYNCPVKLNGNLIVTGAFRNVSGIFTIGENANVSGSSYMELYSSSIVGHVENIHDLTSLVFRNECSGVDGLYRIPVFFRAQEGTTINTAFTGPTEFLADVRVEILTSFSTVKYNINFNNSRFRKGLYVSKAFNSQTITFKGKLVIHSSPEQWMDIVSFDVETSVVIDSHITMACRQDTLALPNFEISEQGHLVLETGVSGNGDFRLPHDFTVKGILEIPSSRNIHVYLVGENSSFTAGILIARPQALLTISLGTSSFQANHLHIEGNVQANWFSDHATATLLPGDYTSLSHWSLDENVANVKFYPGVYQFDNLAMNSSSEFGKNIDLFEDLPVICLGTWTILGENTCVVKHSNIRLTNVILDTNLQIEPSVFLQIDHPCLLKNGRITGHHLIAGATSAFLMKNDDALDLEILHLLDGDGSWTVFEKGFQSLTLEAREQESLIVLDGNYQVENMKLVADGHTLTVDVCKGPRITISENLTTECLNGGKIRLKGNGSEQWIFNGDDDQQIDMELEHGYHVLGKVVNAKNSGTLTANSEILVEEYRNQTGGYLEPIENMTISSKILLKPRLMLAVEGTDDFFAQDGTSLPDCKLLSKAKVHLYAKLVDETGSPIKRSLIETAFLDVKSMNPVMPHLHEPRAVMVRELPLVAENIFSDQLEECLHGEDEEFNMYFSNCEWDVMQFCSPGLYYVIVGVKLFGHKLPIQLRYEIHCER